jgi:formylmethanofuran dehydrogenase subunit C
MITLRLKNPPNILLEAELISPDVFADKSNAEIRELRVYHGKRQYRLDEFFDVEGERSELIYLHGDLHRVRWMGRAMTRGRITVMGNVGMHLGAYMKGGHIEVHGDAGDWIGAEMRRGFIRVHGNAGGQIGGGYRGSLAGMRNGTIIVSGTAGLEVGLRMRRGTIVVGDRVKDFAGLQMKGGTIVLMKGAEIRTGAWMNRGTIISLEPLKLMPTFARAANYNPVFMRVYARHLASLGLELPSKFEHGTYARYTGDMSVHGKGEILVWEPEARPFLR